MSSECQFEDSSDKDALLRSNLILDDSNVAKIVPIKIHK